MRRSAKSAAANTACDRRSRRLRSACPRRDVQVSGSGRHEKARPKRAPAEARSTHMRRARANERRNAGRGFHGRYHGCSSVNHATPYRATRCRNKRDAPPRTAPPRPARPRLARQPEPRARRAAPRQRKRPPGPGRAGGDSVSPFEASRPVASTHGVNSQSPLS